MDWRAEGAADHRRAGAHRHDRDGVDAQPPPSSSSTGTSGMISSCMFSSAPIDPKNSDTTGMARRPRRRTADEPADEALERAEPVDDDPRAADEQDDGDDVGGLDEATRQRDDGRERATGAADGAIGARDDDAAAGRRVVAPIDSPREASTSGAPQSRRRREGGRADGVVEPQPHRHRPA